MVRRATGHLTFDLSHATADLTCLSKCLKRLLEQCAIVLEETLLRLIGDAQPSGAVDRATRWLTDASDDLEQGGFAGAISSDKGDLLTFEQAKGDATEDQLAAEALGQVGYIKDCRGHRNDPPGSSWIVTEEG